MKKNVQLIDADSSYFSDCTYADYFVNKVKVQAIVDCGAPGNIILTSLMKKIKLAPNIDHLVVYGTAGPNLFTR